MHLFELGTQGSKTTRPGQFMHGHLYWFVFYFGKKARKLWPIVRFAMHLSKNTFDHKTN